MTRTKPVKLPYYPGTVPRWRLEERKFMGVSLNPIKGGKPYRCPIDKTRIYIGKGIEEVECPICHSILGLP